MGPLRLPRPFTLAMSTKVPEHVLKKRKSLEQLQAAHQTKVAAQKKAAKAQRKVVFKRAEKYVKEYRSMDKQLVRLRHLNNGVYVRLNSATQAMLQRVEPFVTYGYPNLKAVRELVYKRGFAKVNRQRLPLTDNQLIEQQLGKFGMVCMEDLVHELYTCGPNFKQASKFLWPFKLSNPLGGWNKKNNHFTEGGDAGNREKYINALVKKML